MNKEHFNNQSRVEKFTKIGLVTAFGVGVAAILMGSMSVAALSAITVAKLKFAKESFLKKR